MHTRNIYIPISGWQRKPDGKVKELLEQPTPKVFHEEYASKKKPVVIRGLMKDVPAIKLWEDDSYLKQK